MRTKTPMLDEEICCWMYTMKPSERHLPMATRVRSGMFAVCMAMDMPYQRECVPASSGENPSLFVPTRLHSSLRTMIMMEALAKQIP